MCRHYLGSDSLRYAKAYFLPGLCQDRTELTCQTFLNLPLSTKSGDCPFAKCCKLVDRDLCATPHPLLRNSYIPVVALSTIFIKCILTAAGWVPFPDAFWPWAGLGALYDLSAIFHVDMEGDVATFGELTFCLEGGGT